MKAKISLLLTFFLVATTNLQAANENKYDDVGGFFETVSETFSSDIEVMYISRAMLSMMQDDAQVQSTLTATGGKLTPLVNKIDFIRMASGKEGNQYNDAVVNLVRTLAEKNGFVKCFERSTSDAQSDSIRPGVRKLVPKARCSTRKHLFVRNGEGGLCSMLAVSLIVIGNNIVEWKVTLIGGTFTQKDIISTFKM